MNNQTESTTAFLSGLVVTLFLWLVAPWLEAHGRPVTPEVAAGLVSLLTLVLTYVLPHDLAERLRARMRGEP